MSYFFRSITKIVFRGPRSQGFGFVTFEKESDVEKAVEKLKDSDFDGRKINVERVLPRSERPTRESDGSFRGERGGFRGRGGRFASRRSRPTGPPSTTVVYIGNLPFNAVDKDLENIFSEYPIVSARVVYRPDGRSRGFGFVTLADEAAQKRAIADLAGAECDGRALVIRAAVSEEHTKKEGEEKRRGVGNIWRVSLIQTNNIILHTNRDQALGYSIVYDEERKSRPPESFNPGQVPVYKGDEGKGSLCPYFETEMSGHSHVEFYGFSLHLLCIIFTGTVAM